MPLTRWSRLNLPCRLERMIGFSLPENGDLAVISDEGIHVISLEAGLAVRHDPSHPGGGDLYDAKAGVLRFEGREYTILGLHGGREILESDCGEILHLDSKRGRFVISEEVGDTTISYTFKDMSGDWAKLTFSRDYRYILLGMAHELYVYQRP